MHCERLTKRALSAACDLAFAGLVLAVASLVSAQDLTPPDTSAPSADSAAAAQGGSSQPAPAAGAVRRPVARFELLASAAYGHATTAFNELKLEPYGAVFGLDFGYTWQFGLRLGAQLNYGLGRSVPQRYDRLVGRDVSLTSEAQSVTSGVSLGYDLWLYFLILRYSLDLGISWLSWDLGDLRYSSLGGYSPMKGTVAGWQLAPRVAVLWPVGRFECGLGFHYVVQFADQIPSGLLGELLVGMKL